MVRNLFEPVLRHLLKKEFTIITGARQTGKSTLIKQLNEHCRKEGIPSIFLNLENKNVLAHLNESPFNLFAYLPVTEDRIVVFMDEIQYLKDPSNFLKLLYDEQAGKIKIVATGSSAFYLDGSFKDSLAGRKKIFWLRTCSFDEYLLLREMPDLLNDVVRIRSNPDAKSVYIDLLRQEWETYMLYGGYPAVITEPDNQEKIERLAEIRDSYLKRDVLEAGVQNETSFYYLFRVLAGQSGNLLNSNELSATLRVKHETIMSYLAILRKCFHIALVRPFYRNLRKELTKMPKVYLLDTGLQNSLLNNFQPLTFRIDKGMIWETLYYKLLCEKHGTDDILFWRTTDGNEVDFVMPYLEKPYAVEIKYDGALIKSAKYKKFEDTYPDIPLSFGWLQPFDEDFFRKF
ncbi:MAG: ATP-binding protein [Tannerella sp.]|jgi:predicted AAA+ superfamily ATPase|nr:ATP-binding protein [Tannerella sp.]